MSLVPASAGTERSAAGAVPRVGLACRRFGLLALLTMALAACETAGGGTGSYRKSGADSAAAGRDLADCRARVDAYLAKDRNIDEDRRGTYGTLSSRSGASSVRERADANSDRRRSDELIGSCMQAKGYSGGERPPGGIRW